MGRRHPGDVFSLSNLWTLSAWHAQMLFTTPPCFACLLSAPHSTFSPLSSEKLPVQKISAVCTNFSISLRSFAIEERQATRKATVKVAIKVKFESNVSGMEAIAGYQLEVYFKGSLKLIYRLPRYYKAWSTRKTRSSSAKNLSLLSQPSIPTETAVQNRSLSRPRVSSHNGGRQQIKEQE